MFILCFFFPSLPILLALKMTFVFFIMKHSMAKAQLVSTKFNVMVSLSFKVKEQATDSIRIHVIIPDFRQPE